MACLGNEKHQIGSTDEKNHKNTRNASNPSQFSTHSTSGDSEDDFLQCTELTAGGSKKFFHGNVYQLSLLTLVASRALKLEVPFYLISEAEEFDKFDDVVIDYGNRMTILQVKHTAKKKKYTGQNFCEPVNGDASLAKYFDSWLKFRRSSLSKTPDGIPKAISYIFFTNRCVENFNEFLEETSIDDDDFLFRGIDSQTLKFKKNSSRSRFIDAIRSFSQEISKQNHKINSVEIRLSTEVTIQAAEKLYNDLQDLEKNGKSEKHIDGRSNISMKAMALIRLSQYDERFKKLLVANMKKDHDEAKLMDLWQNNIQKFRVKIENEVSVLLDVMQEEIDEFLDVLLIKVGQPDHQELMNYVRKEIQLNVTIAPNEFHDALNQYMLKWFSDRLKCSLKSQNMIDFIKTEVGDLNRFYALGDTRFFETEYNDYPISLSNLEDLKLYEFLSKKSGESYVACVSGPGVEQRVYSTIQAVILKNNVRSGDWIHMTIDSIHLRALPDILLGRSTKFVIINLISWSSSEKEGSRNLDTKWNVMIQILREAENQKKKLVLIFEDKSRESIARLIGECSIVKLPLYIQVELLKDSELKTVCSKGPELTTFVCGKEYKILDMIEPNFSCFSMLARDLDFLSAAIMNPGSKIERSGLPYDVYVKTDSCKGIPYYDPQYVIINTRIELVVIQGVKREYVVEYFDQCFNREDQIRFIKDSTTVSSEARYRLLEDLSNISGHKEVLIYVKSKDEMASVNNIDYIVFNFDDSTYTMTIAHNPKNIKLPPPTGYNFYSGYSLDNLSQSIMDGGRFSILSAPAGYGKSSFCLDMRWKWLHNAEIQMPIWMVNICLPKLELIDEDPPLESAFTKSVTDFEWLPWQIKCLLSDMMVKDRVLLLLDSFDEVKDETRVHKINLWLSKIPLTVSVLITTRPHAVNEILLPKNRNLDGYFTLKAYSSHKRKTYIERYIRAIVEDMQGGGDKTCNLEEDIGNQVYQKLNKIVDKKKLNLLGIPLESYLFCETLKPKIVKAFKMKCALEFEDFLFDLEYFNTMKLYEVFIREKLILFLTKHKGLSREAITKHPHDLYLFSQHTEIISLLAYSQAFCTASNDIDHDLSLINYSSEMIDEMDDIGLVRVENGEEIHFEFIHETYQEYFAAIHIMKKLILNSDLSVEIRNIIEENRYDLRYRLMFSFMAQISVNGNALVPTFKISNEKHAILFWEIICKDGDILGFASSSLYNDCLRDLNDKQKLRLKDNLVTYEWSKGLVDCIDKQLNPPAENREYAENDDFDVDVAPAMIISYKKTEKMNNESILSKDWVKRKLRIKSQVVQETRNLLQEQSLATLVKAFEEIIEENSMNSSYWDIDGGFSAMALLGNGLNRKIADYFILRITSDPSWRVGPALDAISPLLKTDLMKEAKNAVSSIISCIVVHYHSFYIHHQKMKNLIHNSAYAILNNLVEGLNKQLQKAAEKILFKFPAELEYPILMLKTMLWIAARVPYAVIISDDGKKLTLISDRIVHVNLKPNIVLGEFFSDIQSKILLELKQAKDKHAFLDKIQRLWSSFIQSQLPQYLREKLTRSLRAEDLEEFFSSSGSSSIMEFFKQQNNSNLVSELAVAKFTEVVQSERAIEKGNYWSIDGGIEAVGYTGKFFNRILSKYLILRSKFWINNYFEAVSSLKRIHDALNMCNEKDRHFEIAVSAYNECRNEFPEENLKEIQYSKHSDVSPMDTT